MYLSDIAQGTLARLMGGEPTDGATRPNQVVYALTMTEIESAIAPIESLLDQIDGTGRAPNRWLAKQAGKEILPSARRCCAEHASEWERQSTFVPLPFERTCDACGSRWRIHMAVRSTR